MYSYSTGHGSTDAMTPRVTLCEKYRCKRSIGFHNYREGLRLFQSRLHIDTLLRDYAKRTLSVAGAKVIMDGRAFFVIVKTDGSIAALI